MIHNYSLICLLGISACFIGDTDAILGGEIDYVDSYIVSLQHNDRHFCGAAIINNTLILTAASCVTNNYHEFVNHSIQVVAVSVNDLNGFHGTRFMTKVKSVYVPRDFISNVTHYIGDIAVLELQESLNDWCGGNPMSRVFLQKYDRNNPYYGQKARIAGYGWHEVYVAANKERGSSDGRLRHAEAVVLRPDDPHYRDGTIATHEMCARIEQREGEERGACSGDVGSPLVIQLRNKIVIGILSRRPLGCSERHYSSIYTPVAKYWFFITTVKNHYYTQKPLTNRNTIKHDLN